LKHKNPSLCVIDALINMFQCLEELGQQQQMTYLCVYMWEK